MSEEPETPSNPFEPPTPTVPEASTEPPPLPAIDQKEKLRLILDGLEKVLHDHITEPARAKVAEAIASLKVVVRDAEL